MTELTIQGIGASEGIAIGPAFCYRPPDLVIPGRSAESAEREMERFAQACRQAQVEIEAIKDRMTTRAGEEEAAIFEAHLMMLADPMLEDAVRERVEQGQIVEQSVREATQQLSEMLAGMQEELFAARAADVRDVGQRILRILLGLPDTSFDAISEPVIVVAHDLTPSDTAGLHPELTLGFCTAVGGLTSHTAILARTLGIPAVVGLGAESLMQIENNVNLILDGANGAVILQPDKNTVKHYQVLERQRVARLNEMQGEMHADTYDASGRRIEVVANVGELESAREAAAYGAEGVGLLRTEFLYLGEQNPPSEDKQIQVLKAIFAVFGEKPVIVRTLDIGGDKPPPYLKFPTELNPFLGWRAIRISLDDLDLFKTQLRAILQAAVGFNVLLMYPMIISVEELRRANQILAEVKAGLAAEQRPYKEDIPVGIMVETPAAAVLADVLAQECDFLSMGTNDLTQYTLAVDRTNERIARLYQPLHPAVLRLIKGTIDAAHAKGKWAGMCGELAGMKKAIPILLGFGLDEFSIVPRAIPEAKWLIRQMTAEHARQIAEAALRLSTAEEVETYMEEVLVQYP
jgi:phosphotransferase system enzyme I (PtsI)